MTGLLLIPILTAYLINRFYQPAKVTQTKPTVPSAETFNVTTDSDVAGISLALTISPSDNNIFRQVLVKTGIFQNPISSVSAQTTDSLQAGQTKLIRTNKGLFIPADLAGSSSATPVTSDKTAVLKQITVKKIIIHLTNQVQPNSQILSDDKKTVDYSVGNRFDQHDQTLYVNIQINTGILWAGADNSRLVPAIITRLFLADLYQLTHRDISNDQANQNASTIFTNDLQSQPLFSFNLTPF